MTLSTPSLRPKEKAWAGNRYLGSMVLPCLSEILDEALLSGP